MLGISNIVAFLLGLIGGGVIMRLKEWHRKSFSLVGYIIIILEISKCFREFVNVLESL